MKRRIKRASIRFISLVPAGANRLPVILKEDGLFEMDLVSKASEALDEIHAIVYTPENRDSQGDIASAEVIKQMAYSFQQGGGQLDLRHDGKALDKERAFVAETFIVQKGDPRFKDLKNRDGILVEPTGAWGMVIKLEDEELKKLYKEGKWSGVSLAGTAELEAEKEEDSTSLFQFVKSLFNGEKKMSKEFKKDLEDLTKVVSGLAETVKEMTVVKKEEEPKVSDSEAALIKERDEMKAKLEKPKVSDSEAALIKERDEMKARLAKLEKSSNQDPAENDPAESVLGIELNKEECDLVARASKVAEILNKRRGL